MKVFVALASLLGMAAALPADAPYHAPASYHPAPAPYHPAPAKYEKEQPQPYQYRYGVADEYAGTNFEKAEEQDGYGNVAGSYTVNLPDGRQQIVTYTADHENGYVADVKYVGEAQYPEEKPYHPAPAKTYHPAPAKPYHPAPQYPAAPPKYHS